MNRLYKPFLIITYLLLFGAFTSTSLAQVPANNAINVAINTTYDVPDGSPDALADGVVHDLAVLNSAGDVVIGDVTTFTYDDTDGNPGLAGPDLVNYTDFQWVVVLETDDPTDPAKVKFGPFTFTTIGPEITLTGGGVSIAEDGGTADLTVTASAEIGKNLDVEVTYTGTSDPAHGTDFTNTGGANPETITITAGDLFATTTITGVDDTFLEGDETVIGTITALASGVIDPTTQTITITDDETISISRNNATIAEDGLTVIYTATVSSSGTVASGDVTVTMDFTGGTAISGTDFSGAGNITITDGTSTGTVTITSIDDSFLEGDETIVGEITALSYGLTGTASASTTITDAESLILSGGATINEAATTDLTATVSDGGTLALNGGGPLSISLAYSGTADRPGDYNNSEGEDPETLTLPDGDASISTTITPVNDDLIELDETVIAAMTTGVPGLTISGSPQTVTITDDTETVLLTPLDDAVGQVLFTPLTWSVVLGANQYRLFVNTAEEFDGIAIIEGVDQGDNQDKVLSGLSNATEYFWRVEPRNGGTRAASSDEVNSFTTSTDKLVTLTFPKSGETVFTLTPTLFWTVTNTEAGLTFEYQINTSGDFTDADPTPIVGTTATSVTTATLTGGTTYSWRVRSKTTGDLYSQWSTVGTFVTQAGLTAAPVPIISWPTGNPTLFDTTPTLYWYLSSVAPTGATLNFDIEVELTSVDFDGTPTYSAVGSSILTNFAVTTPLVPGASYHWQVRTNNITPDPDVTSAYSSEGTFTISIGQGGAPLPVLSWPISGVTVYTITPTLYWYLSTFATGAVTYDINVDDDAGFGSPEFTSNGQSPQFVLVNPGTPLTAGTTYFWRVRTNNGANTSAYVTTNGSFVISSTIASAPAPVLSWPIGGATVYSTKPTLNWYLAGPPPAGATIEYDIEVDNDADFGSVTDAKSDNTTQSYTVVTALTPGTYYWRVKTNNVTASTNSGFLPAGDGTAANSFVVSATASGVAVTPTPIYPTGNVTVGTLTPTLSWFVNGVLAGDETYTLELKPTSIAFDNTGLVTGIGSQSTTTITLTAGTAYRWRVLSVSATNGTSSFSAEALFTTSATLAPPPPIGGGPINGAIIANGQPDISWFLPTAPKTELMYKLQISEDASMNNIAFELDDIDAFHTVVNSLKGGTTYYWRVQSKDPQGVYSAHSIVSRFATGSVTAIDNELVIPQKFTLEQNYPNPFNPTTTIRFALPEASFVILRIYNMLGQEVKTLVNGEKNAGTYNVQWRGDNNFGVKVSSGTYIYRVIAGQNIFVKKMILLK